MTFGGVSSYAGVMLGGVSSDGDGGLVEQEFWVVVEWALEIVVVGLRC